MKILRGYAEAATNGGHNWRMPEKAQPGEEHLRQKVGGENARIKKELKSSGDTITISAEAKEMLENGGASVSTLPQDTTYDQNGYVLRQVDSLHGDLRNLASHLMSYPEGAAMAGKVRNMQTQLNSIQAFV